MKISTARSILLALVLFAGFAVQADSPEQREALLLEIERIYQDDVPYIDGVSMTSAELLSAIYERRDYRLAWDDEEKVGNLIQAIEDSPAEGLSPSDYNVDVVVSARQKLFSGVALTPAERARIELLFTESYIRLIYHQFYGKVNPYDLDANWNYRRDLGNVDPAEVIAEVLDAASPTGEVFAMVDRGWVYLAMKNALADHRGIVADGGWPTIPDGPTLRPGETDERLATIERRLAISGDVVERANPPSSYDAHLEDGVRRFQERHALDVDGIIGKGTLNALNVSAEDRVLQIELNLERMRWVFEDITDEFVLVNIAGFDAALVRDEAAEWSTNVQVGKPYHQSPVFRDEIKYIVFNPTWTAPYSIATKSLLPAIKNDPDFFEKRNFDVKDRSGNLVDPKSIDWQSLSRGNFPYTLVQRPGPDNAMGRVKFMFPNEHAVYLHDTPSKYLFDRAERTFSHGCIRVENPFEFADELLGPEWDQERIQATLDTLEPKTVFLPEPIPILLMYMTTFVDEDGTVFFYKDVYDRDQRVARALDEPFRLELPES